MRLLGEAVVDFHPDHHRIGPAPDEIIFHFVISSSTFEGPQVHLSAVPNCGVEWDTMRGDGVMTHESRHILRTPSDELICARLSGLYDAGNDGFLDALDDALTSKARAQVAIHFYTAAKEYRWLNRAQLIGFGQRDFSSHTLDLHVFCLER